jgi:FMN-dependent NADH-azoreductase
MPAISTFYGIIIRMYHTEHNPPHIHAHYQENHAVYDIKECDLTDGTMPKKQNILIKAWMELHKDELLANWELAQNHEDLAKIEPLK